MTEPSITRGLGVLSPEERLEFWRGELARVLKARTDLPWPNLIDWAEEDEQLAAKTCTRAGRARLVTLEQRLAAMEKLAGAWQQEAERARKDLAVPADMLDVAELRLWVALERPLTEDEVHEHTKILRFARHLSVHAVEVAAATYTAAKARVTGLHTPVKHMGKTWCAECSVRRRTGPRTEEWVAFVPHPCPTLEAIAGNEPVPDSEPAEQSAVPYADRRDHFAKVMYEHWNPNQRWEDSHADDRIAYRADADAAMKAADTAPGGPNTLPQRGDVYLEVADRLSLYAELEKAQQAGVTGVADKVREWARGIDPAHDPIAARTQRADAEYTEHREYEVVGGWGVDGAKDAADARHRVQQALAEYPTCGARAQWRTVRTWDDDAQYYGPWQPLTDEEPVR